MIWCTPGFFFPCTFWNLFSSSLTITKIIWKLAGPRKSGWGCTTSSPSCIACRHLCWHWVHVSLFFRTLMKRLTFWSDGNPKRTISRLVHWHTPRPPQRDTDRQTDRQTHTDTPTHPTKPCYIVCLFVCFPFLSILFLCNVFLCQPSITQELSLRVRVRLLWFARFCSSIVWDPATSC